MSFSLLCWLAVVVTTPFGVAFLAAPEFIGAQYGIVGWNAGTLVVARLFGVALLYLAGAVVAVLGTSDVYLQRSIATWFSAASLAAAAVSIHAVTSGAVNAVGWSTVVIYAFFALAWASVGFRRP